MRREELELSALLDRRRWTVAFAALLSAILLIGTPLPSQAELLGPTDGGQHLIIQSESRAIAEGIEHSFYERMDGRGRNSINVLTVDLAKTDPHYLDGGKTASVATLTEMAKLGDVDAAINGGFFDIGSSGAVFGTGVQDGEVVKTGAFEPDFQSAVISKDGVGSIANLVLDGKAVINDGASELPLQGLNLTEVRDNLIGVYDSHWGSYNLATRLGPHNPPRRAVRISNGVVTNVDEKLGETINIPEGDRVLLARGEAAIAKLDELKVGDKIEISIGVTDDVDRIATAIGGNWDILVRDGNPLAEPIGEKDAFVTNWHPRTAIGFGNDGKTMYMVTVDGRNAGGSRGMSLYELGRLMQELGATQAINLDGGGSTTLVAREPGEADTSVQNVPSDSDQRRNGNGIGVTSRASDGVLSGINIDVVGVKTNSTRVFPGAHRGFVAKPHDRGGRPVEAEISWSSSDPAIFTVNAEGVITAVQTGSADLIAKSGDVEQRQQINVLEPLSYLTVTPTSLQMAAKDERRSINVFGHDTAGFVAPLDSSDVQVTDAEGLTINPGAARTFELVAAVDKAGGLAKVTALGKSAEFSYLIGQETVTITDFSEGIENFRTYGARGTQSIEKRPGEGIDGSDAVAMTFDFTQATQTRTANIAPNANTNAIRKIEGTPIELVVTVKVETPAALQTYMAVQGSNASGRRYFQRTELTTEWQELHIPVPAGTAGPFNLVNFMVYEDKSDRQYKNTILIDSIKVVVAPEAEAPAFIKRTDQAVTQQVGDAPFKATTNIAIMSDAQFVGRNPNSSYVEGARRSLREIVAAKPNALYIVGDFTDEGKDEDFALAARILDEEVSRHGIPWTYVPGNHEIMGSKIDTFVKHFGPEKTVKTIGTTRVITLDSSPYALGHNFGNFTHLRSELDRAAQDDSVNGVLVAFHHPTRDFMPNGSSGLNSAFEAELIEKWLADFSATSGKPIALAGAGVGAFHVSQKDGVLHITNGNSGKKAESSADWGGFRGWTMLHIDQNAPKGTKAADWMKVQTRPWVDAGSLKIEAPDVVKRGETIQVDASFTQALTNETPSVIPVRWPVSAYWSGEGIFIGAEADAPADAEAAFDPSTRTMAFLPAAGEQITLSLAVNGQTATRTFRVIAADVETTDPTPSYVIEEYAAQHPEIGEPTGELMPASNGSYRDYQNARVYWSEQTGITLTRDAFNTVVKANPWLGMPTESEQPLADGSSSQQFEYGSLVWHPSSGLRVITGAISAAWQNAGGASGEFGLPTSEEIPLGGGRVVQHFEDGDAYWAPGAGAWFVYRGNKTEWERLGGVNGYLGAPTGNEVALGNNVVVQTFEGGRIYWSPTYGARAVHGGILERYLQQGGHEKLGVPATGEYVYGSGVRQDFARSSILWP